MTDAPPRWHLAALLLMLLTGGVLRFTALGHGIPFAPGIDEPEIMERAVRMMRTGDFHPRFFDYPGLYIYLQMIVACVRFIAGSIDGLWSHLDQASTGDFYLWGRAVTATLGTATIAIVYFAARRISPLAGLFAAALFAVQSLHVRESHFVLTDVPMTFFVALTMLLSLRAGGTPSFRAFAYAGMAVGAAAATKYNGGVAMLFPVIALVLSSTDWAWRLRALMLTGATAGATFLVCAPYTVLALPEFLNAFAYLADMYADGPPRPEPAWLTYLKHLRNNYSIPSLAAAGLGAALALRVLVKTPRGPATPAWLMSAAFTLVYYDMVSGQRLLWARYLLPLLPTLCVLSGGGLAWLVDTVARRWPRPSVTVAVAALLLVVTAVRPTTNAVSWLQMVSKESTNAQAYKWMLENLPPGSRIASETREVLLPADRYSIEYRHRLISESPEYYQREGFDYLIASSALFRVAFYVDPPDPAALAGYSDLFRRAEHVITFMPDADHPGSEFRVYRVVRPD